MVFNSFLFYVGPDFRTNLFEGRGNDVILVTKVESILVKFKQVDVGPNFHEPHLLEMVETIDPLCLPIR